MSQNPGYGQNYGQPAAASGHGQRQAEHEVVPPARPAANYRGFNAYHCFGTVIQGAHSVTWVEISSCVFEVFFSIWIIVEYFVKGVGIKNLFLGHMISLGLSVLNLVFSYFVIKTLIVTGCRGACAPIAWTVVICLRILLSIYLVIIVALLLSGSTDVHPAIIIYLQAILVITIIFSVFGILIYSYFIAVMAGFIRFKLASRNETDEDDAVPITDYNPNANPDGEVEY